MSYPHPDLVQRSLVIIKPDNWRYASSKPGTIIDMFSRTGLRIVGVKVHRMSVAEALDFYGQVKQILKEKLSPVFAKRRRSILRAPSIYTFPTLSSKCSQNLSDSNMRSISLNRLLSS